MVMVDGYRSFLSTRLHVLYRFEKIEKSAHTPATDGEREKETRRNVKRPPMPSDWWKFIFERAEKQQTE